LRPYKALGRPFSWLGALVAEYSEQIIILRAENEGLLAALEAFADPTNWNDEVGRLQWIGKRHAIEYAQSVLKEYRPVEAVEILSQEQIDALFAENARLRAVLEPFARHAHCVDRIEPSSLLLWCAQAVNVLAE